MASILTIRPSEEIKRQLKEMAKERGLTLNALIIQILWEYLNPKK